MPHCCGPKKKPKQKKVRWPEAKQEESQESFWKKLLKPLGLEIESRTLTGGN